MNKTFQRGCSNYKISNCGIGGIFISCFLSKHHTVIQNNNHLLFFDSLSTLKKRKIPRIQREKLKTSEKEKGDSETPKL